MAQIQSIFFAKNNISELNELILNKIDAVNIVHDGKKEIVNILLKNMKTIIKQLM
jgi:hypothetical protein